MIPQANTSRPGAFNSSAIVLLAALALLFVLAPLVDDLPGGDQMEVVLLSLVLIFAVLAVADRRRTLILAVILATPPMLTKWISHLRPDLLSPLVPLLADMTFFAYVIGHLLSFVLRARHVNANVLCAGLAGYLLLGLSWMPAYLLIARINPNAFVMTAGVDAGAKMDGFHAFYFSFVTLCTVGYGDVTPVSKGARMLAITEAIAGLFYVAVLISRLVSIYSSVTDSAKTSEPLSPDASERP